MPNSDTLHRATAIRLGRTDPRWLLAAAATALAGFVVFVYWWAHSVVGPHHGLFDLQIYFRTVRFWAAGNNIYDYAQFDPVNGSLGFTYPPLAAALMWPMAALSWPVVEFMGVIGILAAAAVFSWLSLRERIRLPRPWMAVAVGGVTTAAFLTDPIRQNLSFGQVNLFLGVLVLLDLLVLQPRGSRWTGVGIGLAMAIKLTPGVFLLYLVLGRQWRALVTALLTAAAATAVAALVAPTATWAFYTSLVWQQGRVGHLGGDNQSLQGLLARIGTIDQPDKALWLLLVVAVGVVAVTRIRRALLAGDRLAAITLTGFAAVLISPVSWPHHLVWLIPALVILVDSAVRTLAGLRRAAAAWGWALALRPLLGPVLLLGTGVLVLGFDTRDVFDLPFSDGDLPLIGRLAASLLMFWTLATLLLLPIRTRLAAPGPAGEVSRRPSSRTASVR